MRLNVFRKLKAGNNMLTITNHATVKSLVKFIKSQKLKKENACVDDGECNYKIIGYRFHNFFFEIIKPFLRTKIIIYIYNDNDEWMVR